MYKEYADIKLQMKYLESKADELKVKMIQELRTIDGEKVENEYGKFSIGRRNNWTYSTKLEAKKQDIKVMEIEEQEKGVAKLKVTEFVTFKEIKND
ncbi:MAG: hypothetical protein ACP5N7_05900 [Candidatus Pacearchaeota archaeon]